MMKSLKVLPKQPCNREIKIKCKIAHFLRFSSSKDRASNKLYNQLLLKLLGIPTLIRYRIFIIRDHLISLSLISKFNTKEDNKRMIINSLSKSRKINFIKKNLRKIINIIRQKINQKNNQLLNNI